MAAAALVLAWTCAAQLLWVIETPAPDARTPASIRVVLATGLEGRAAPKTKLDLKHPRDRANGDPATAPKSAPAKSSPALSDGMTPAAPKAPCFRRALSGDLDVLALLAALHADGIPAAVDALACGAARVRARSDGPGAPPQLADMVSSHGPRPPPAPPL
jgi:hypothetical protein